MNAVQLYQRLRQKGYQCPEHGTHMLGGYCCADAVYDFREDFTGSGRKELYELLTQFLELDRREVFRVWCGAEAVKNTRLPFDEFPAWQRHLHQAHVRYEAGLIGSTIDYLLREKPPAKHKTKPRARQKGR